MTEPDPRAAELAELLRALDRATSRAELLGPLESVLEDARSRHDPSEPVPGTPLDTAAYHLARGSRWWEDPELALGGALLAEAAGYVEQKPESSFHLIALADALGPGAVFSPLAFNVTIAQRIALGSHGGHFGQGLHFRRMLAEDWIDARGMLHVVDRLLDKAPAGSRDRPLLLLDRAQALLHLARRGDGDERILALARQALADGTTAQNALRIGADDAMFWLERPFVAGQLAADVDDADRFIDVLQNLQRALRAAAEHGVARTTELAIRQAFQALVTPRPNTTSDTAAALAGVARGLLGFPLPDEQADFVLYALADNLTVSYALDKRRTRSLLEAERAARAVFARRPEWPIAQQALVNALSSRGDAAATTEVALAVVAELQELTPRLEPTWTLFAAQANVALQAVKLGANPAILRDAIDAIDRMAEFRAEDKAWPTASELALRVRCLVELVHVEPERALPALEAATRHRPSGRATGDVLVLRTEHLLPGPVADAAAAAAALRAEEALWDGRHDDHVLGIVGTLRGPIASALTKLLPEGVAAEDVVDALVESEPGDAVRIMVDRRFSMPQEPARAELALAALRDPQLPDNLREVFRSTVGTEALTAYGQSKDPSDLDRAAEYLVPADPADDEHIRNKLGIFVVLDALASQESAHLLEDPGGRRIKLMQWIIADPDADLVTRVLLGRRLQEAFGAIMWGMVTTQFAVLVEPLRDAVAAGTATAALEQAQGMASRAAFASVRHGDSLRAIEFAEQGQGILAAAALRQHGVSTDLLHLDHPELYAVWAIAARRLQAAVRAAIPTIQAWTQTVPSEPPTRLVSPVDLLTELSSASPEVAELVAAERAARSDLEAVVGPLLPDPSAGEIIAHLQGTEARLVYLMATIWGGMGLVVHPDGRVRPVELPDLTTTSTSGWIDTVNAGAPEPIARDATVRGSTSEPPQATTEGVLRELSAALAPLTEVLATDDGPIQLVPMGSLALLPVGAALQSDRPDDGWLELSVAASARLHIAAANRRRRTSGNTAAVAVTNPSPATRPDGTAFRNLPAASLEGEDVAAMFEGIHHTRDAATLAASIAALSGANRVLHFAVHGEADPDAPERSRMYLVDEVGGRAGELTAGEVARSPINSRLVYLGSCWTGRPGSRLPDEAVGFPTLLLQSGAAGVVAPMWPIEDAAAYTFARAFYREWRGGATPASALAAAMRHTRARHPWSMTWAAFALHGV